jgi:hypothetical protein
VQSVGASRQRTLSPLQGSKSTQPAELNLHLWVHEREISYCTAEIKSEKNSKYLPAIALILAYIPEYLPDGCRPVQTPQIRPRSIFEVPHRGLWIQSLGTRSRWQYTSEKLYRRLDRHTVLLGSLRLPIRLFRSTVNSNSIHFSQDLSSHALHCLYRNHHVTESSSFSRSHNLHENRDS